MAKSIPIYEIIRRPVSTEKTTYMTDVNNQYVFEVHPRANKIQVREAVEIIFDVDVANVAVMNMPAKRGWRGRRRYIRKSAWKKAVVTIEAGQKIPLFEA
ncbi:MAG: 50S ribosomal protein L23 [Anaerolineae bacterium]|nr:50S ribosomal protein L23 [Anaerolineae bacterium]